MCVKNRRSVGCARNDGKVKTENGVQDESDKGMMYYIMLSCFARWHFSCAIERKTLSGSIAQTVTYNKYAPVCSIETFLVFHLN